MVFTSYDNASDSGQQIASEGATTLAGSLVRNFGKDFPPERLTNLFPANLRSCPMKELPAMDHYRALRKTGRALG